MKYSILFCMICVVLSGCSTSQSVNRNPSSEIGNAELDEFHEFDSDSESVFSKLASNAWSQKFDTVGVQLLY